MAKIISKARQARLNYQAKIGRSVPLREVAETIGITNSALSRIEQGKTERIDFDTLSKLCAFYGVGVGEIIEFDPNGLLEPGYAGTALAAA